MEKTGTIVEVFGMRFGLLNPNTLSPHPLNYRTHPEKQKAALKASIKKHGFVQFPIYNETTKRLIDGHARVEDAKSEQLEAMPVLLVNKTEAEERDLLASLDRIGEMRGHDDALLARLLQDCLADEGVMPAGWNEDDLGDLLIKLDRDQPPVLDLDPTKPAAPSKPKEPRALDDEDDDGIADPPRPSSVKQINLFLTTESEPEFQALVKSLGEHFGTTNITDTVLFVLRLIGQTELGIGTDGDEETDEDGLPTE